MERKIRSVLLVDDDNINNFINQRLIKKLNFSESIHTVTNGQEALDFLRQKINSKDPLPELILLDINMPVMDGFEFIEQYRNLPEKGTSNIIVLTTSTNDKDMDKVSGAKEVSGFINKPLTEEKLTSAIGKLAFS
ncbi:MAG TPA: response regulator [Cytophagaceae bacterium]|jgi:CheY-like chemotaxis protein